MTNKLLLTGLISLVLGCKDSVTKETVQVDGDTVNITSSSEDNYNYKLTDLTNEQNDFINQKLAKAKLFVSKYLSKQVDNPYDSKILDTVLQNWSLSIAEKESVEEVIDIIGAAFGQGIVEELNCEWKSITDQYGTDITVIHKKYVVNGFPFSSVQKIVTEENPRSLNDIKLILKDQIETADKTGEMDLRN